MKCGLFIIARLGSQRLQAKHIQLVAGQPVLLHLIRRISHAFAGQIANGRAEVVVVTSDELVNRNLADVIGLEASIFYGSINNIPLRQLQAAEAGKFTEIVSIDGDDILCSPSGMLAIAEKLTSGKEYVQTSELPFGMNSFGYTHGFLQRAVCSHQSEVLETGWGRIFAGKAVDTVRFDHLPRDERFRFTLDYPEDLAFFRAIFEALGARAISASDNEIIQLVLERQIYSLNAAVAQEYWANFRRQVDKERTKASTVACDMS